MKKKYIFASICCLFVSLTGCYKNQEPVDVSIVGRINKYTEIIKKNPQNANAYIELARAYNEILFDKTASQEALKNANKALSLSLTDIEKANALLEKATASNNEKNEAFSYIKQALSLSPNNARAYQIQGVLLWKKKQYKLAMKELDTSLKIDPQNATTYYWRGRTQQLLKNYQKALEDYSHALQYAQTEDLKAWVYTALCSNYVQMKQLDQQMEDACSKGEELLLKLSKQQDPILKKLRDK